MCHFVVAGAGCSTFVRRYNERTSNDRERFVSMLADIVDRRVTYRDLIGVDLSPATT